MSEDAHSDGPARGASIVNLGLAAVAAGALGFLVFAMPEDVFSDLVVQSGLPAWLPAAEPPLGLKARAAVIAAVALLVFALVLLLLRGVDRLSARPAKAHAKAAGAEAELEAPRLRRVDAHPDAPAPRPILAGRDLGGFADAGEYDYPPDSDDEMFADLPAEPLPGFLTPSRDGPEEIEEGHFEESPFEAHHEESEAGAPEPQHAQYEESGFEPARAEEEPLTLDTPADDRGVEAIVAELPEAEEPLVLDTPADDRSIEAMVSQLPEAEEPRDNSITSLMRRLETGLVRREEEGECDPLSEARAEEQVSAAPSWLAPQPAAQEHESEEVEASGPYEAGEPSSPPPSWLAPQPAARSPEPVASEQPWEAEEAEAEEQPIAAAPAPAAPTAANFPPVDEFGEPSWPAPSAGEPSYAPLGAPNRGQSAAPKIQAIAPQPVRSAPAEVEAPSEMSIGRRLRSAIADMDKIASSGG